MNPPPFLVLDYDSPVYCLRRIECVHLCRKGERYVREPVVKLHALRYLALAGRATPPKRLAGLFGSSALPDVIFDKIIGFWKEPEPVWVLELGGRPVALYENPKYPVVIDATAPPD